jgi:Uma2 family endonuclease
VIPVAVLDSVAIVETQLRGGSSLRVPMSPEEFRALGETKHAEYYDGMCVVNPPSRRHVVAVRRLAHRLEEACPAGFTVYPDWGWRIGRHVYEPDIMVAPVDAPEDELVAAPLLVVEVLSPSTRDADLGSKMAEYAAAGAPWYWTLAGPEDRLGISLVVWRNGGAGFVEAQRIQGRSPQQIIAPIAIAIDPQDLFA